MQPNDKILADFDKILRSVFELSQQPKYIIEVDSQDGELLSHALELIKKGQKLSESPVEVVALIQNPAHLEPIRKKLDHLPHRIALVKDLDPKTLVDALKGIGIEDPNSALFLSSHLPLIESRFGWIHFSTTQINLLDLAAKGWFPLEGECFSTLINFEKRAYKIRMATLNDLPILVKLEELCWPKQLGMPLNTLQKRIETYPEGQLVLEDQAGVEGVVYSQRIAAIEPLYKMQADTVSQLHTPNGPYIQLLALNILPEKQQGTLGGELLEFALQKATLTPGVTNVIGVTRCIHYPGPDKISMEDYLKQGVDPVPHMHTLHGAEIRGVVPHYRPKDSANAGFGVLVHYSLKDRIPQKRIKHVSDQETEITLESIGKTVDAAIIALLPDESKKGYRRSAPLMDLGLDSLQLMDLRALLSEAFLIELNPTFFFQYGTADATIEYLIDKKIKVFKEWLYEVQWRQAPIPEVPPFTPDRLWVFLFWCDSRSINVRSFSKCWNPIEK